MARRYKKRTAAEESAIAYLETMGGYERTLQWFSDRLEGLQARLENVGSVRLDGTPAAGGYEDAKPALLDDLGECIRRAKAEMDEHEQDMQQAMRIIAGDFNAQLCWMKYAKRMTWRQVGKAVGYSATAVRNREHSGLVYVYSRMPEKYKG